MTKPAEIQVTSGVLSKLIRTARCSNAGNPQYRFTIGAQQLTTLPNAMFCYEITRFIGNRVIVHWKMLRGKPTAISIKLVSQCQEMVNP